MTINRLLNPVLKGKSLLKKSNTLQKMWNLLRVSVIIKRLQLIQMGTVLLQPIFTISSIDYIATDDIN